MGEHKWDDGVISVPATCAAEGTKTYTCTVCKATKTEPIAKQAHDYRQTVVAATCTAKGYTLNKCSRCGDEYRDGGDGNASACVCEWCLHCVRE